MTKKGPLDIQTIIVNALIESNDIPVKLDSEQKKEFAQKVANLCEKRAFDKSRDSFKNEIAKLIKETISKSEV